MGLALSRLGDYLRLTRFHRPAGTLLLLWPTLWSLWATAKGFPGWYWLTIIVGGVIVMRAFGCVINDISDRRLDAAVTRTRIRPLAAGRIRLAEAVAVAVIFLAAAGGLWLLLPPIARWWAVAALVLTLLYPLSKRFMALPQAFLGVTFSFGIPVAEAAYLNAAPSFQSFLFFTGNFLWIIAYDTIYAMADRDDDRAYGGIGSTALFFGKRDVATVGGLYAAAVLWLSATGILLAYGVAYQITLIAAMVFVFRFHRLYRTREPAACLAAFHLNHWFGAFIFAGIVAEYI